MDIQNSGRTPPTGGYRSSLRLALVAGGVGAMLWSGAVFRVFLIDAPEEDVSSRILIGEDFPSEALQYLDRDSDFRVKGAYPQGLRSASIIRLRRTELAIGSLNQIEVDADLASLQRSLTEALANTPTDSFLWLALFWSQNAAHGFGPQSVEYLRMSYLCGAHEGWIAARRNRLAIAMFYALPTDIRAAALVEFNDLVAHGYIPEAAKTFMGPGWDIHDLLVSNLAALPHDTQMAFTAKIAEFGYNIRDPFAEALRQIGDAARPIGK
jgi:hypothetical protein